jgi:hypothetical protein
MIQQDPGNDQMARHDSLFFPCGARLKWNTFRVGRTRVSFRSWSEERVSRFEIRHVEGAIDRRAPQRGRPA